MKKEEQKDKEKKHNGLHIRSTSKDIPPISKYSAKVCVYFYWFFTGKENWLSNFASKYLWNAA